MKRDRLILSLAINSGYALFNCVLGFVQHSWWLLTLGAYYAVLAVARALVMRIKLRSAGDADMERFVEKVSGILLTALSLCIAGMVILSAVKDRGTEHHEIVMIAIAVFAFYKVTFAIIGLVKVRGRGSPVERTLRNIALAAALVSIYSLQRSMLVSFPGMEQADIQLMNILTGSAVCLMVLLLGLNLIGGYFNMAKSKIVEVNEKIAEGVVEGYKKIEKGVVDGYKKIEQGVVEGYSKVEDKFIENYLTREGETVEEAKARLKQDK